MKESAFYQDILQEGRQEGRQAGRQEGRQAGRQEGRQEGRQAGRQEGRQEGEVALLMRLLVKRFGNVSESIESRLIQASIADLELWSDRILEAKTLTDIFD
jgi:predicted transposase YdaD